MIAFILLAAVGLILLLISAFFEEEVEAAPEVEGGGPQFLSLRSIAVFLTAFGTVGAIARYYEL
ncbi:MAG: hypothetical protein NZ930_02425 [Candidatus Bipolaricaulota bacterium]|nr:hypothetical protein [Candidatus Bipolaricaulota bacterium]MDW8030857.1 hypothetical protein [Candidatus Bipolaricaulota bacterium]